MSRTLSHLIMRRRLTLRLSPLILVTGLFTITAYGADLNNPMPAKPMNTQPKGDHLLGDWDGMRTSLADNGIALTFDYIGQFASNVSGGKRTGFDYAQQLELKGDVDWSKIAGIAGLSSHVDLINRAGRNLSKDYIGDSIAQVQSVYGGGGDVIIHLAQFYDELSLASGTIDIAAGRLSVGQDFATSSLYCNFMSTMVCGYPHSIAAKEGFTTFPNSTWGSRIRIDPVRHIYIQAGAYEVRPRGGGASGFNWSSSGTTGAYFPMELGYEPAFGADDLTGHYKVGFAHDTSNYPDLLRDAAARPFVVAGTSPFKHDGRNSAYVLVDQMLMRNGTGPENGLAILGGYVSSDPHTSQYAKFAFIGLTDQGLVVSRPNDTFSIMAAWQKISPDLAMTQTLEAATGLPLSRNAIGLQKSETVVEMDYDIAVGRGVRLMPDLQYVINPSAAHTYPDALVIGLQIKAAL